MPWQLRATAGPLEGAVYVLRRRVTLGRAGDCDIQIINDGVSRRHAKVVAEGERYVLIDLSSNNGTYVGDERVQRHVLGIAREAHLDVAAERGRALIRRGGHAQPHAVAHVGFEVDAPQLLPRLGDAQHGLVEHRLPSGQRDTGVAMHADGQVFQQG